jgi:hypothetical protein
MDYKWKGTPELVVGIIIGAAITWGIMGYKYTVKQYSIYLKCIQGELYKEIKPNIFAKSHLEYFEQTRL